MKPVLNLLIAIVMISTLLGAMNLEQASTPTHEAAYVEPGLWSAESETLSLIVTATNSQTAAGIVESVGGQVSSDLWLVDSVAALLPAGQLEALAADPGIRFIVQNKGVATAQGPMDAEGWVTDYRFPVPWDGSPDVEPTHDEQSWKLVYPTVIDVGADVFFDGVYSETEFGDPIRGDGITIAVIDSGVYFSEEVKHTLGNLVAKQFIGQADFVADGLCSEVGTGKYKNSIIQGDGFCWTDFRKSQDGYGHGTHVAGIVWNRFEDDATRTVIGVAPQANVLSVRVLGDDGVGTYEDVIEGIQYVVQHKDTHGIRVLNMSLSATPTTPYFADPLDRAAEAAWANGIVVVAAAGNSGPQAETITVPGNDPYVITVGAIDGQRTPGYWLDDSLASWSATGPTLDGFPKPDILAPGMNIVAFMYNDQNDVTNSALLVQQHPDYSETSDLFRMNGTSMSTAVTSGVVALMLQAHPELTPDQVKYRLMVS
ncbi:MAG: S8 family peptidase, partial [Anaerolineae bacterium]|nr:S8 family peptidase [Anaerolineae bacterium]